MESDQLRLASVLSLFRSGKSKREIANELGMTKDAVKRDLAIAIRRGASAHDSALSKARDAADTVASRIGLPPGSVIISEDYREETVTASAMGVSVTICWSDSTSYIFPSLLYSAIAAKLQKAIQAKGEGQ